MTAMRVPEGCELVPRWITINGDRGFVLRGEQIAEQLVDQAKG